MGAWTLPPLSRRESVSGSTDPLSAQCRGMSPPALVRLCSCPHRPLCTPPHPPVTSRPPAHLRSRPPPRTCRRGPAPPQALPPGAVPWRPCLHSRPDVVPGLRDHLGPPCSLGPPLLRWPCPSRVAGPTPPPPPRLSSTRFPVSEPSCQGHPPPPRCRRHTHGWPPSRGSSSSAFPALLRASDSAGGVPDYRARSRDTPRGRSSEYSCKCSRHGPFLVSTHRSPGFSADDCGRTFACPARPLRWGWAAGGPSAWASGGGGSDPGLPAKPRSLKRH